MSRHAEIAAIGLIALALAVAAQILTAAYSAEFGQDDASHYVSGRMIAEYLREPRLSDPLRYLAAFHAHFPMVGIGHWPAGYYAVEALWMLGFSPGSTSMLLLSAAVTTATAVLLFVAARGLVGGLLATVATLAFMASPLVQENTAQLMLDIPVAALMLAGAIVYARYLVHVRFRDAVLFGLCAAAALMVKGNAGCLALLPPLVLCFTRRWELLRAPSFWAPALVVLVLCGPWYAFTYGLVDVGFRFEAGWDYFVLSWVKNTGFLVAAAGLPACLLAIYAIFTLVLERNPRRAAPLYATAAALVVAVMLFQSIVPVAVEARYVLPALLPVLVLAAIGLHGLCGNLAAHGRRSRRPALAAIAIAAVALVGATDLAMRAASVQAKPRLGIREAAAAIRAQMTSQNPVVLIVDDPNGEAAATSELLMTEPATTPKTFVLRGSRILGGGGYNNHDYATRFTDIADVMAEIESLSIPLVLVRNDPKARVRWGWSHVDQVEDAIRRYPERWVEIYVDRSVSPTVRVYALLGNRAKTADTSRLMDIAAPRALKK